MHLRGAEASGPGGRSCVTISPFRRLAGDQSITGEERPPVGALAGRGANHRTLPRRLHNDRVR